MLPNKAPLFPFSLDRALLAEHLTFPQDVEPGGSAWAGMEPGSVWGRDADIAGVLLQVLFSKVGMLFCVL